jgi:hypothetical protein
VVEKSRAKIIADLITAECRSDEPDVDARMTNIAMTRAIGDFLAHFEATAPDAFHLYMTALRTNLRAIREAQAGNSNRNVVRGVVQTGAVIRPKR